MSDQYLPSGNYLGEVWNEVVNYMKNDDIIACHDFIHHHDNNLQILDKPPYFLLIDIHGFTRLCYKFEREGRLDDLVKFLQAFFRVMSERIYRHEIQSIKFIGDAILCVSPSRKKVKRCANYLVDVYQDMFKPSYPETDLVALITQPRIMIKGFAKGIDYVDYSYWGSGLNYLFKVGKDVKEGHVWFVTRKGNYKSWDVDLKVS